MVDPVVDLVDVAARMESAFAGGMKTQLQWLEDAATALDAVERADADDGDDGGDDAEDGAPASQAFKAALGAIVTFARGKQDAETLPELETVVRALLTRGTVAMYRTLSSSLRELADVRTHQRSLCLDLAGVFTSLARSTERGEPAPRDALERLAKARDALAST